MAGTRTAPTVDGSPGYKHVGLKFVDRSGDERTIAIDADGEATDAEIEALAAAAVPASQGSLFEISVEYKYKGARVAGNAEVGQRNSVFDQIIARAKSPSLNLGYSWELPAPVAGLMVGDTDTVNTASTLLTALYTALGAIKAGYGFVSVRYTEKKEINKAQKL